MRTYLARFRSGSRGLRQRLRQRRRLVALVVAPGLAALLAVTVLPGRDGSGGRTTQGQRPAQAARSSASEGAPLTLVTGDTVRMTPAPDGRAVVSVTPPEPDGGPPVSSTAHTFQVGGDVYSVPDYALAHLGSLLDPRLFDVSYLRRAGYADLDALPVSISWRQASHSDVPGLTSPRTGTTTTGSVSLASARAFGRALSDLSRSTLGGAGGAARSPAAKALSQVTKITLAPLPAAGSRQPGAAPQDPGAVAPAVPLSSSAAPAGTPLYTLTVNPVGRNGRPGFAVVYVQNLKDLDRYYSINVVTAGDNLDVSVPAGPYGVEAIVFGLDEQTNLPENIAFVPVPQVDVAHDTMLTVDARKAEPVEVSVPRDAAPEVATMAFARSSADGSGLQDFVFTFGPGIVSALPPVHMFAVPTPAPRLGSLGFAHAWELVPPDSGLGGEVSPAYTYSLDFASADGVPSTLSRTLREEDLAAVHDRFAASVPGSAWYEAAPFHSWSTLAYALWPTFFDFPVPTERTDYFGGSEGTVWAQSMQRVPLSDYIPPAVFGPYRTFQPGEEVTVTWGASPSVPAPERQSRGLPLPGSAEVNGRKTTYSYVCAACRQGDLMTFNVPMSGDGDPTHTASWFGMGSGVLASGSGGPTDSVRFYRNGTLTQISGGSGQVLPMLPERASYTIDWTSTVPVSTTRLSTSVRSVWTFTSARPTRPDRLPAHQLCAPDSTRDCAYVPLVFASYDFGANLSGEVAAPGTRTFTLTGYHQFGEDGPAVSRATVEVSFDDGATWSPTRVTGLGGGRFRVSVDQPDPSATTGYASFRVRLADTAGNTLEQTVTRAYALSGPAAGSSAREPR
jgi:hypothetical protein